MQGTIVYTHQKGYGFIRPDDGSQDVFLHASAIAGLPEWDEIQDGQRCEFEPGQDRQGRARASRVVLL